MRLETDYVEPTGDVETLHRTVVLSERNLLSLLTKLYTLDSACEIEGGVDCPYVSVRAEPDDAHYGPRGHGPGPMHPVTERLLKAVREVTRGESI